MEASRERSGLTRAGTLETGKTTRKMALVFSSTRMATSMRDYGKEINVMVKALTGVTNRASYVENTQVTGSKTRSTVEVPSSIRMEIVTMAIGSQACHRERVA